MSTQYQSSRDVPTEVLAARLNELADVVAQKRDRIGAEFTMRIPAEFDRDADLVMSEAAVRLGALQAECEKLRKDAERYRHIRGGCDMSDYKLVPVKPTIEMAFAGIEVYGIEECADADVHSVWEAMIAAAPAVQGEPVAVVDADDDGMWADILPDVGVKVGQPLYAAQQPAEQKPDVTQLVEVLTELCDEIDKHEIHAAISKTSISWFKRKARDALAAHRKQQENK